MISRIRVISVRLLQALLLLLFCLGIEKLILKLYEMKGPGTVKAWPKEKRLQDCPPGCVGFTQLLCSALAESRQAGSRGQASGSPHAGSLLIYDRRHVTKAKGGLF